ncbi:hypothetical protein [Bifidobacterium simiarum]|uniref:Uncharacterized protein n=1 Tax=Bifidobacterium simiarum TaxID=2045441 RepID=A0A2M9HDS8_9BIFI|nr:hypothetical protein [Bifidobacterium simiarum]PJM74962.1 hypothetical protein CSQ87_06930 [Bifidobacterium simiarum]
MAVIVLLLIVAFVHAITTTGSASSREHRRYRVRGGEPYHAVIASAAEHGLQGVDAGRAERIFPFMRATTMLRILLPFAVIPALGLMLLLPGVPAWTPALIGALALPWITNVGMDAVARHTLTGAFRPVRTPVQQAIHILSRLLASAPMFVALLPCYLSSDGLRTVAVATAGRSNASTMIGRLDDVPLTVIAGALMWLATGLAYAIMRIGARAEEWFATKQFNMQANESTVLYLRSFKDDRLSMPSPYVDSGLRLLLWPRAPFEEMITLMLLGRGNVITVGRPGEQLPRAGAVRNYFNMDDWQDSIRLTAHRASRIIMTVGETESLSWEISHLREWNLLGKCVFLLPPVDAQRSRKRITILLDVLGVRDRNMAALDTLPYDTIVAMHMLDDGSVGWIVSPGRDWMGYLAALSMPSDRVGNPFTVQDAEREREENARAKNHARSQAVPLTVPPSVNRANAIATELLRQSDSNPGAASRAMFRKALALRDDGQLDAYGVSRLLFEAAAQAVQAKDTVQLERTLAEALPTIRTIDHVWVRPTKDLRSIVAECRIHELLAMGRAEAGDEAGAYQQALQWQACARKADEPAERINAALAIAEHADDADEALSLARSALAEATRLSNLPLQARAAGQLALILHESAPQGDEWRILALRAADIRESLGESEQAGTIRVWVRDASR